LDEFYQKQNEKLLKLKELFFQTFSPSDYRIIAITLLNRDNVNTWHLMDIDYIERFKDKQPVLQFGSIKINAQKISCLYKTCFT